MSFGYPTFLSYSALKLYGFGVNDDSACPYAHYIRYIMKKKRTSFNCRNFYCGHVSHSCQEEWVKTGMKPGTIKGYVDAFEKKYRRDNAVVFKGVDDYEKLLRKMNDAVEKIEAAFFALKWNEKRWEVEFALKVWDAFLGCFFYAKIDLFDKDSRIAADLKVTDKTQFFDRRQGVFIVILERKHFKDKSIDRFIQFVPLRKNPTLTYFVSEEERIQLYLLMKESVLAMRGGNFDAKPTKSKCFKCEMNEFCDKKYSDHTDLEYIEKDGKRKVKL